MGANSTGQTPNQRLNDQVSGLLDSARRQASQTNPPRMEDLANWDGNPTDGQTAVYSQATGLWGPGGGGGKRYSTVVVAASDASHHSTADADYVCTGTNDEVTINQACAAATAVGVGNRAGRVLLTEGNFNCGNNGGATAGIIQPGNAVLEGMGSRNMTTTINLPTTMVNNQSGINSGSRVAHIDIEQGNCTATGVYLVIGLDVDDVYVSSGLSAASSTLVTCSYRVRNCFLSGAGSVVGVLLSAQQNIARDNTIEAGTGLVVGIPGSPTNRSVVRGNIINVCSGGGIQLTTAAVDSLVHDNLIAQCGDATHDGISVSGTRNSVQSNVVRKDGASAGSGRYGINVLAGATDNLVTNNDLKNSGATGSFLDSGTGTITAAGNRL